MSGGLLTLWALLGRCAARSDVVVVVDRPWAANPDAGMAGVDDGRAPSDTCLLRAGGRVIEVVVGPAPRP